MAITNNVSFAFPPNTKIFVNALSNSGAVQHVAILPPTGSAATFEGKGEGNVQMNLATKGFLNAPAPGGQPFFMTPATGGDYKITVTTTLPNKSKVIGGKTLAQNPSGGEFCTAWVNSEDSADGDYDDSLVLFTYFSPASPI
ncbi:MAG TPA: hypothetical protein VF017_13085 [Thermoanaerobaculia bacterium]|nr:hypothetical protein [Thermoanaerobaculia bacterium]